MFKLNSMVGVGLALAVATAGISASSLGQVTGREASTDSLVRMLRSPDWQVRGNAIARLNLLPAHQLPSSYAATIIPLLDREATSPDPHREGDGYGEYLLAVVQGVVRLRDPRSLRGLALLGIQMSREAQEYVASQGVAGVPFLDEAWTRSHSDAVATTWAYMLGQYQHLLPRPDRVQVMARLIAVLPENPRAFTWAALTVPLPEVVPLLEDIAARDPSPIVKKRTTVVLDSLRARRDQLSSPALLARLSDWLDAFCSRSGGGPTGPCQALTAALTRANREVELRGPLAARPALEEFSNQADQARAASTLTDLEHRLLRGNAQYLVTRAR